ncbi:hypothetical protein ACIQU5_20660 [Streptomyces sp. NPDC090306]|uniref:hypothetical protein n=1 Tax=unclassified Streptomyces TaxID=2593676 RepID=UPI0036E2C217
MHMNSVPQHLLSEDRQEYERILDEALRSAPLRPELAATEKRLNTEQLRTMALNATALITVAAAAEYQHYVRVRDELRHPARSAPTTVHETGPEEQGSGAAGLAATMGEVAETTGAGAAAVVVVLAPVLAAAAAAIFLLVGYVLKMLTPEPAFARTMLTAGWVFGAMAAIAVLVAAVLLLLTALHNRPPLDDGPHGERYEAVERARLDWGEALVERGIVPFLREALADPGTPTLPRPAPSPSGGRMPHLGYDSPGFSSPDDAPGAGHRPSFSSPDYSSPDYGGPEHQPD